jgi:outer membrane lipoprotein-sorting protein
LRDWKAVDGVRVAHTMLINQGTVQMRRTIDKVEFNVAIDDSQFARPVTTVK